MKIAKPCVYLYHFSCVPTYASFEDVKKEAEALAFGLIKDLQLKKDSIEQLKKPHHDVTVLSFYSDEDTETYLLQLLSTILRTIFEITP